jgi:hypothetical protein
MVIKEEQDLFLAKAAKKKIINKKLVLILKYTTNKIPI